jgi:hypothetical protein
MPHHKRFSGASTTPKRPATITSSPREAGQQRAEPSDGQSLPESVQQALNLAGAWSDLDWDETVEVLDRIRHESVPTPPIDPQRA